MRTLAGVLGANVGLVVGFLGALLLTLKITGDDDFGGAMLCIITVPVGLLAGAILGVTLAERTLRYLQRGNLGTAARRKKALLMVGLAVFLPALVVGMFHAVDHHDNPRYVPPSDQRLLANFQHHQAIFSQLVWMIKTDKILTYVGPDLIRPGYPRRVGITQSRIGDYRRLMSKAEVLSGFETTTEDNGIDFYYWGIGCANASENGYKGYAYLTKPPKNLLSDLSEGEYKEDGVRFYRHVQGHWYLFYLYLSD